MLCSSPFKVTRFVQLSFIWVVSSGRNTIIAQYVKTYKIKVLDSDLIVIIIFCTITGTMPMIEGHTTCINQDWFLDFEYLEFAKRGIDGKKRSRKEIESRYSQ